MKKLKSNHLILSIILNKSITSVHFYTLINSDDSAINFINTNFAALHHFPL